MRLADAEHTARPWRIHAIAPDFELEDVWAFRTPGAGPEDFPLMLDALRAAGGLNENPPAVRFLFAVRWKLGALLRWDRPDRGLVGRVGSLVDRLPPELRQDEAGTPVPNTPFTMVYELPDECAIELANKTVHDICHLGWVPSSVADGEYELRMAALVKPNGRFGRLYMAAIKPFRYLVVYPAMTRKWERAWQNRHKYAKAAAGTTAAGTSAAGPAGPSPVPPRPRDLDEPRRPEQAAQSRRAASRTEQGTDEEAPRRAAPLAERRSRLVKWAGRLIVLFGSAHTLGALAGEGAARHAGAWFRGELWGDDLATMSPANSAYWLTVNSFGPSLVLVGLTVLWLDRRGIMPPPFIAWAIGTWTVADTLLAGPGIGQGLILLVAVGLLLAAARRATHSDTVAPVSVTGRAAH